MNTENTLIALAYVKETENPLEVFGNYILICLLKAPEKKLRHDELCNTIVCVAEADAEAFMKYAEEE